MKKNELLEEAHKRVRTKKEFYVHGLTFCVVMLFLFLLNYLTTPDFWWVFFPLGGWGIGLMAHYFSVFGFFGIKGKEWEKKEFAKEVAKLRQEKEEETYNEDVLILPDDELELKEKIKIRQNWKDEDLV